MTAIKDYFKKVLGWCPNADPIRTPVHAKTGSAFGEGWKGGIPDPVPEPAEAPWKDRPGYRENLALILIALAWLFPIVYQREFLPIIIVLSVAAMYVDAQNINAGMNFEKETLFGNIVTWRPLTWGAATFVGAIIIMAIYIFHRREIYNANYRIEKDENGILD